MSNPQDTPRPHRLEQGQSFIEMALSFVFFLFFVMGLLDLGRLYFQFVALEDAAGEAALYLALNVHCPSDVDSECSHFYTTELPPELQPDNNSQCADVCTATNNAWSRADEASNLIDLGELGAPATGVTVDLEFVPAAGGSEDMVQVTLEYPFDLMTPIIADIVGANTVTLTAQASQVVLSTGSD